MSKQGPIKILQLYPREMNMYGDWGNVLTLKKRLEWRGYDVALLEHHPGAELPDAADIVVGGGGQDSGQSVIQDDLQHHAETFRAWADGGVPMLMICGMYQLFGKFFKTSGGQTIPGIGIFDIETYGGDERLIGNIVTRSELFGDIVGYENHSGLTYLKSGASPLARVINGEGNNTKDDTEGVMRSNVIGTYLHGSLLPKNPQIADWLIKKALEQRGDTTELSALDDTFADNAKDVALTLSR
jgi:lipid II isoglutaminyl synthase (glutamine-hydrolysing)